MLEFLTQTVESLYPEVSQEWGDDAVQDLVLHESCGSDSSSGHTNTQQKCDDPENEGDEPMQSLLVTSVNIIALASKADGSKKWLNPTPHSVRLCQTLSIDLEKETTDTICRKYELLSSEVNNLQSHEFQVVNGNNTWATVRATFQVDLCLFDGKCANAISGNKNSAACPMCTQTDFTQSMDDYVAAADILKLGPTLLNAEIEMFEHFLQLAYKKGARTWACGNEAW